MAKFTLFESGDNVVAALRPQLVKRGAALSARTFGVLVTGWFALAFAMGLLILTR
jgi:hypothetical protein